LSSFLRNPGFAFADLHVAAAWVYDTGAFSLSARVLVLLARAEFSEREPDSKWVDLHVSSTCCTDDVALDSNCKCQVQDGICYLGHTAHSTSHY